MNGMPLTLGLAPFTAVFPGAAEPPVASILAADPANGRILAYVKDREGVRVETFASGAPLVEPVAMIHSFYEPGGILVVDRAGHAVYRFGRWTGEFLGVIVRPGTGGLRDPIDLDFAWGSRTDVLVLSADGAVRRFDIRTGAHLATPIAARGEAWSLVSARDVVLITYPHENAIRTFDARTGELLATNTQFQSPRGMVYFGLGSPQFVLVEDRAGPILPDRIIRLHGLRLTPGRVNELPAGLACWDVADDGAQDVYVSASIGLFVQMAGFPAPSFFPAPPGASLAGLLGNSEGCYADCDTVTGVPALDVFDYLCFQNKFAAGTPYACDCDTGTGAGVCDIFDFLCFQNFFAFGCP